MKDSKESISAGGGQASLGYSSPTPVISGVDNRVDFSLRLCARVGWSCCDTSHRYGAQTGEASVISNIASRHDKGKETLEASC